MLQPLLSSAKLRKTHILFYSMGPAPVRLFSSVHASCARQVFHLTNGYFYVIIANNKIKISLKERRLYAGFKEGKDRLEGTRNT